MGHCLAYKAQACNHFKGERATVKCCRECSCYHGCLLSKCLNHPEHCGKYESEKAVKVYGKNRRGGGTGT